MPGTLTKADIISAIQAENGYSHKKSIELVEILIEIIKSTLESGELLWRTVIHFNFSFHARCDQSQIASICNGNHSAGQRYGRLPAAATASSAQIVRIWD